MAERIKSGIKRDRQSKVRRDRNIHVKSTLRSTIKSLLSSVKAKDVDKSKELLKITIKALDKAATKGVLHKRTASRNVSKLSKRVHNLSVPAE